MSASTVIGDVTQTLHDLLTDQQPQLPKPMFTVSLISPAEEPATDANTLNLFLFRVTENPFAKNQEWTPVGTEILRYPPLALDLFYVLTPFAKDPLSGQRILGEAMRILHDNGIITAPLLKGSLEYTAEELKIDLWQSNLEDTVRIWNALTKPYRLFVAYSVRMVLIDSAIERSTKRVLEKEDRFS